MFRDTSESTNERVVWWSIIQTCILIATGLWQITHLKNFFKAKVFEILRLLLKVNKIQRNWCEK